MADFDRSFSVGGGLSFNDVVGILADAGDPSVVGQAAPVGSLYIRTNADGILYIKTGTGDTDWESVSMTPRQAMCYTALRC